jgi:twitching motility protein PilT
MPAKLDGFLQMLIEKKGDAIILESGGTLSLARGEEREVLLNVKRGELTNEHVRVLVGEIAAPAERELIDSGMPTVFEYASPVGKMRVELLIAGTRMSARITPAAAKKPAEARGNMQVLSKDMRGAAPSAEGPAEASGPIAKAVSVDGKPAIERYFQLFLERGASDLHMTAGKVPAIRVDGEIVPMGDLGTPAIADLEAMLLEIMPKRNLDEFTRTNDTDFAYELPNARLRANVFRDRYGAGGVFRKIPGTILTTEQLNLPAVVVQLCQLNKGLVLVTGPTGSGKSTTLAAMVDYMNRTRAEHILTIEDPIEFIHEPKKCIINQRQVGMHTDSFARALKASLREDPNIILIGEMRDLETIAIAVEMAETGHLVMGTLHTTTAASTVDRIIDQFPADRQEQIRQMLAESLKGVVSQTLCKKKHGGRIAALEILLGSVAVTNLIREKKTFQISSIMQTSKHLGMKTLNDALIELVKAGTIDYDEAYRKAVDKGGMATLLNPFGFKVPAANGPAAH